jgi:hypothetical protein
VRDQRIRGEQTADTASDDRYTWSRRHDR